MGVTGRNNVMGNPWVTRGSPVPTPAGNHYLQLWVWVLQSSSTAAAWLRVQGLVWNFADMKQGEEVLDIGFSSCTAPTFCRGPDISNISS